MKLLLWGAIGFIVVMWLLRGKSAAVRASGSRAPNPALEGEAMVKCAHCGLHVPASESIAAGSGMVFCSEEHRLRHGA